VTVALQPQNGPAIARQHARRDNGAIVPFLSSAMYRPPCKSARHRASRPVTRSLRRYGRRPSEPASAGRHERQLRQFVSYVSGLQAPAFLLTIALVIFHIARVRHFQHWSPTLATLMLFIGATLSLNASAALFLKDSFRDYFAWIAATWRHCRFENASRGGAVLRTLLTALRLHRLESLKILFAASLLLATIWGVTMTAIWSAQAVAHSFDAPPSPSETARPHL